MCMIAEAIYHIAAKFRRIQFLWIGDLQHLMHSIVTDMWEHASMSIYISMLIMRV